MIMSFKRIKFCIGLTFLALIFLGTPEMIAITSNDAFSATADPEIMPGYVPSTYKKKTGYHIEHFGFIGGHFSRVINEYDTFACCKPTGNKMDGCSAPIICPKY